MVKFVEDLIVCMGRHGEPVPGVVLARGTMCGLFLKPECNIDKTIEPAFRKIRTSPTIQVRQWFALDRGEIWMATGYYEWTRWQWFKLWWRALRSGAMGRRIPRARTVRR